MLTIPVMQSNAADLLTLWEKMKCEITDKTSLRYLNKFGETVKKFGPKVTGMQGQGKGVGNQGQDWIMAPPRPKINLDCSHSDQGG